MSITSIRRKAAGLLARLAQKLYKNHPETVKYWEMVLSDKMIYGQVITRIDPTVVYIDMAEDNNKG